jgi:hypothetical protein
MEPEIKVTKIKNRWHARLTYAGTVWDEMACDTRVDIGYICRTMMRWFDKNGGCSKVASDSRARLNQKETNHIGPQGQIWYQSRLNYGKN